MSTFKELLQASFKSNDTEEWLDVHFTPNRIGFRTVVEQVGHTPQCHNHSVYIFGNRRWMDVLPYRFGIQYYRYDPFDAG